VALIVGVFFAIRSFLANNQPGSGNTMSSGPDRRPPGRYEQAIHQTIKSLSCLQEEAAAAAVDGFRVYFLVVVLVVHLTVVIRNKEDTRHHHLAFAMISLIIMILVQVDCCRRSYTFE
jgi:hypothetical protein